MPHFFDPTHLTDEQKARWDAAKAEYSRVIRGNIDRQLARMTPDEKVSYVQRLGEHFRDPNLSPDEQIRRSLESWTAFTAAGAGHPKSALFARLLDGKPAFEFPPPTAFSYPWYEVVEEDGPFSVMVGGVQSVSSALAGARGVSGAFGISLNQCTWAVQSMNEAARRLLTLQDRLSEATRKDEGRRFGYIYGWTEELLAGVLAAYADNPEIIVQHGEWPVYRLYLAPIETRAQRGHISRPVRAETVSNASNVFEAYYFRTRLTIGATLTKGQHPRERYEAAKARLASKKEGEPQGLDKLALDFMTPNLEAASADFERDPTGEDMVIAHHDAWFIQRAG